MEQSQKSVLTDQKTLELERKAEEAEREALAFVNEVLAEWDRVVKGHPSQDWSCESTIRNIETQRVMDGWYSGASGVSGVRGHWGNSGVSGVSGTSGVKAIQDYSHCSNPAFSIEQSGVSGVIGAEPPAFVSGTQGFEWPAAARVREDLQHEWDAATMRCRWCNVPRSSVECGFNPLHLPDRSGGGWNCHRRYLSHLSDPLRAMAESELERLRIYGPDWIVGHEPAELERKVRLRNNSIQPLHIGPVGQMVQPGEIVEVPVAVTDSSEIRTAIMLGYLTKEEADGSGRSRWFKYLFGNDDQRYGA